MIKEVLETMVSLAEDGMTMICVTHEMGFAKTVAHRVIFMDSGEIIEQKLARRVFHPPQIGSDQAVFKSNPASLDFYGVTQWQASTKSF
jgi:ABC-type polar amino acid transport system ATPase subunit